MEADEDSEDYGESLEADANLIDEGAAEQSELDELIICRTKTGREFTVDVSDIIDDADAQIERISERTAAEEAADNTSQAQGAEQKLAEKIVDHEVISYLSVGWKRFQTEHYVRRAVEAFGPLTVIHPVTGTAQLPEGWRGWIVAGEDNEPIVLDRQEFAMEYRPVSQRDAANVGQQQTVQPIEPGPIEAPAPRAPSMYDEALRAAQGALERCLQVRLTNNTRKEVEDALGRIKECL